MTHHDESDDEFARRVFAPVAALHIDDAGFTDRVVLALPPRKRRALGKRDVVIGASFALAGAVGASALGHPALDLAFTSGAQGAVLAVVAALALWGAMALASE